MTRILTRGAADADCFLVCTKSSLCPLVTVRVSKDVFETSCIGTLQGYRLMVANSTQELLNLITLPVYVVISVK